MLPPRRVVTGHRADGTAIVLTDGPAPKIDRKPSGITSTLIWSSDAMPVPMPLGTEIEDFGLRVLGTEPPRNGSRFCVNDFPPGNARYMHRTDTLDYAIVLDGEIEMEMDEGTTVLHAGDVVVQRGTNHAWINRSQANARIAFVLIDALPSGTEPA